jgi:ketosteroid isomerase-like protein
VTICNRRKILNHPINFGEEDAMATNAEKLRVAYQAWGDSKGQRLEPFLEFIGEDFVMRSVAAQPSGLQFAGVTDGPSRLVEAMQTLLRHWSMDFYRVETLISEGDEVAMFGRCGYTFKDTRKSVDTPIANLWRFRNGKAYECIEIFDSAKAAMAAMPD